VVRALRREYYPWQLLGAVSFWLAIRRLRRIATKHDFILTDDRVMWLAPEWEEWKKFYTPSLKLSSDSLILDAGAGEGETILLLYLRGFRNFRCVESDASAFNLLQRNVGRLPDASFDLRNKMFGIEDLNGVAFAKIDIEGGEIELLKLEKKNFPAEIVVEIHNPTIEKQFLEHLPRIRCLAKGSVPNCNLWSWVKQ